MMMAGSHEFQILGFTNIIGAPNHTTTLGHVVRLVHFLDPILYGGLFSPKSGRESGYRHSMTLRRLCVLGQGGAQKR